MKSAVCLLVPREGRFLSVSRRNDNTRWGMPGGKVDPGESNVQALQREVFEEVRLSSGDLTPFEPLHVSTSAGDTDFWVTTYLWRGGTVEPRHLRPEDGLEIAFLTEEELCSERKSPFAVYNRRVFHAYHLYLAGRYAMAERNQGGS